MKAFAISLMFVACLCILIALIKNTVNTEHANLSPRNGDPIHFQGGDENLWWFVQVYKDKSRGKNYFFLMLPKYTILLVNH